MPKNIVIFSDGTGQDGGVRPEQRLSNIYKMYRAARPGPDSQIDPRLQVAFYDPGLGTDTSATGITSIRRGITKLLSSVTGRGITTNIADCYEFIVNHYTPGDRIWLFGFSRGAYTARCIANVLMLCGVPTKVPEGELPRFRLRVREISGRAVIRVYEHGAGHDRAKYEEERDELARRFRHDFGSDAGGEANVAPYFVGVFDTVASLGAKGPLRIALAALVALLVAAAAATLAGVAHWAFGIRWTWSFLAAAAVIGGWTLWGYLRTALKIMWPPLPGRRWPSMHLAQWSGRNFDRLLSRSVLYARHAIAIDENRADFPRLKWGWGKGVERPPEVEGEAKPFIQLWFAGNHSDIGGSYPESESRLSDISLQWMLEEARSVPHPLLVDDSRLRLFPSAAGLQHDEVAGMADTIRARTPAPLRWLTRALTWKVERRQPIETATLHPSVEERFELPSVPRQGGEGPYRPEALRNHERFRDRFGA
ncbi:DUF2235 domain-containing protein [Sphingomonas sp. MM-1]|uniref:DUF2235 domain-containing protein n=1 Tax=Sphingomonas sp. MM-1 TaxID=745310 RepID=UPI0005A48F98|nr:DUF2235 domain-containing protein [Sphingomonas sp. MM-1]